ncbi:hypothetical protein KAI04_03205 [Candidatus Pacearchaeota archaeon]|nr:hypothetical protein [Candidatus Pacearchaeota archaeon]
MKKPLKLVGLEEKTKIKLDKLKQSRRETYDDVVVRLIDFWKKKQK